MEIEIVTNFLANIIEYYIQKLYTWHRYKIVYYFQTNIKIDNFNGTSSNMLTKYLIDKLTKFWDKYLSQALFTTRIWINSLSKYSPYYLLYY